MLWHFCYHVHLILNTHDGKRVLLLDDSMIGYISPQLFFYKPNLWWPNGMGKQSLYNVEITVDVEDHGESDSWSQHFGFRKIESDIDSTTGGRY